MRDQCHIRALKIELRENNSSLNANFRKKLHYNKGKNGNLIEGSKVIHDLSQENYAQACITLKFALLSVSEVNQ